MWTTIVFETIRKYLETCKTLAVTNVIYIPIAFPEIDEKDINTDQKLPLIFLE